MLMLTPSVSPIWLSFSFTSGRGIEEAERSTIIIMTKLPLKMVWLISIILMFYSASIPLTFAMSPTLSWPTTVIIAFMTSSEKHTQHEVECVCYKTLQKFVERFQWFSYVCSATDQRAEARKQNTESIFTRASRRAVASSKGSGFPRVWP